MQQNYDEESYEGLGLTPSGHVYDEDAVDQVLDQVDKDNEETLTLLRADIRAQAAEIEPGSQQARLIVDHYWRNQRRRLATNNQVKAIDRESAKRKIQSATNVLEWLGDRWNTCEKEVNSILKEFSENHPLGQWLMEKPVRKGIGPFYAATLLAFIDPARTPTVGHIWSFFGYNPNARWVGAAEAKEWVHSQTGTPEEILEKAALEFHRDFLVMKRRATTDKLGKKAKLDRDRVAAAITCRPWNPKMKAVGYLIGSGLIKQGNETYGQIYTERKAYETSLNERGEYAEQCRKVMREVENHAQSAWYSGCYTPESVSKVRAFQAETKGMLADLSASGTLEGDALKKQLTKLSNARKAELKDLEAKLMGEPGSGVMMLPISHIHMRCQRYMVKQLLSDYFSALYRTYHNKLEPLPYAIAILGHAHVRGESREEARQRWAAKARA